MEPTLMAAIIIVCCFACGVFADEKGEKHGKGGRADKGGAGTAGRSGLPGRLRGRRPEPARQDGEAAR